MNPWFLVEDPVVLERGILEPCSKILADTSNTNCELNSKPSIHYPSPALTLIRGVDIRLYMELGNIIEYIDRQKIICAVILDMKNNKAHLLNESNREVSLSLNRILHAGDQGLDLSLTRDQQVAGLQKTAEKQIELSGHIDVQALWDILHTDPKWIDVPVITSLCFPDNATGLHESAVIRALFNNREYFKFDRTRFLPYSAAQVEQMKQQAEEAQREAHLITTGRKWLGKILRNQHLPEDENKAAFIEILRSTFLFEKESPHYRIGKEILNKTSITNIQDLFPLLVKLNVFDENENIDLHRMQIPVAFSKDIATHAAEINPFSSDPSDCSRTDFSNLALMTIDGPGTQDFDDALSIRDKGDHVELGVHIVDVAHFIKKGDVLDKEAFRRGSSIYMPDLKVPMLPTALAENLCSLKAREIRPAISLMIKISKTWEILDYEIVASMINVKHQLTYQDADLMAEDDPDMKALLKIAKEFRNKRLEQGAVHILLPEIHFRNNGGADIQLMCIDRESPGRLLVAEIMILANWLFARHLGRHHIPAVFRSQQDPKERLYRGTKGTLFQNYMQRRLLNRFTLSEYPERHSGLGLDAYITATSPIRKYFDLVSQRQIRATLGLETPYTAEEIKNIIQHLGLPLGNIGRLQTRRNRFWILKHLAAKTGERVEALTLQKKRNGYQILLQEFMIECLLPVPGNMKLKPEDLIHVKIQHVDPRKDVISVFMG